MYQKPVMTGVGTADKKLTDEATLVYWVIVSPAVVATAGTLKILDGVNTSGWEKARISTGHCRLFPFYPPIRCDDGLFIDVDSDVGSFTVGYLPESVAQRE